MANTVQGSGLATWLIDPIQPTEASAPYQSKITGRMWGIPLMVGGALLAASVAFGLADLHQFFFSYLIGWSFCVTLSLGGMFFVLIQHLTTAHWSVTVRRIAEALAWSIPFLGILFIPIIFGMHDLYHWTHAELFDPNGPGYDPIIAGKEPYLNTPFFIGRMIFYFVIWTVIAHRLYKHSVMMDVTKDPKMLKKLTATSAWGLVVMAVTVSFFSFDAIMSTYPHWFSTIFGVYIFGGSCGAAFAFIALMGTFFQRSGMLKDEIRPVHYHDSGKFMFGFTVFWAYIAFSQYMLIWYANLPEETVWFRYRLENGWEYNSLALLVMHFIIPFAVLITQWAKKTRPLLAIMGVWFLVMHWFDLHWLIMPVHHEKYAVIHLLDITTWLGLFGILIGLFMYRMSRHSMLPEGDPKLKKSMTYG